MALLPQDLQRFGWPTQPMAQGMPTGVGAPNVMGDPAQAFTGLPPMQQPTPGASNSLIKRPPNAFHGLPRGR